MIELKEHSWEALPRDRILVPCGDCDGLGAVHESGPGRSTGLCYTCAGLGCAAWGIGAYVAHTLLRVIQVYEQATAVLQWKTRRVDGGRA